MLSSRTLVAAIVVAWTVGSVSAQEEPRWFSAEEGNGLKAGHCYSESDVCFLFLFCGNVGTLLVDTLFYINEPISGDLSVKFAIDGEIFIRDAHVHYAVSFEEFPVYVVISVDDPLLSELIAGEFVTISSNYSGHDQEFEFSGTIPLTGSAAPLRRMKSEC